MLKAGLIMLGIAAGLVALLALLSGLGLSTFGPCGPDPLGLAILLGILLAGGVGSLFLLFGGLMMVGDRIYQRFHRDEDA